MIVFSIKDINILVEGYNQKDFGINGLVGSESLLNSMNNEKFMLFGGIFDKY